MPDDTPRIPRPEPRARRDGLDDRPRVGRRPALYLPPDPPQPIPVVVLATVGIVALMAVLLFCAPVIFRAIYQHFTGA